MQSFHVNRLSLAQVRSAYAALLIPAFPEDELKPLRMIEQALGRGEYLCYGASHGDDVLAAAFFVRICREGRTLMLFDYFVVREDLRCRGLGSRFLQALIEGPLKGEAAILLEVDEPSCAETPGEEEIRNRRLAFYLRNGLVDTGAMATVYGVTYRILCLNAQSVPTPDEARRLYAALYHAVLPPQIYRQRVFIEGFDESTP